MTVTVRGCRKCGASVPEARGRLATYCSVGCRRSAEHEVRRLDRALEAVEEQLRMCAFGWGGRVPADAPKYQAELARLEARLRHLLDDPDAAVAATESVAS